MKLPDYLFMALSILGMQMLYCQDYDDGQNPWIIGLGLNIIDDSGTGFNELLNFKNNYNFSTPVKGSIEKRFGDDHGFEVIGSFNKFQIGKTINGSTLEENIDFLSIDGMYKYYVTNSFLDKYRAMYEGYLSSGLGMTFYNNDGAATFNLGTGLNYFVSESVRFNAQIMAKISVDRNNPNGSNYIQYAFGIIIRLKDENFD